MFWRMLAIRAIKDGSWRTFALSYAAWRFIQKSASMLNAASINIEYSIVKFRLPLISSLSRATLTYKIP